jgi:molybdopterin-containing oxidoreductase family iron-sulfur binding subunit
LTGVIATTRLACDASRLPLLVKALATMLQASSGAAPPLDTNERIWLERAADDLQTSTGKSLLTIAPELAPECHATAALINEKLKNNGATVWYSAPLRATPDKNETLPALCEDMAAGSVETLIVAGSNPVYSAPHELNFSEKLKRVSNRIHAGLHFDETAQACDWHVPLHHALESWSDARAVDGTTTLLQPVIRPLYASKGVHELFDLLAGVHSPTADGAIRATWRDQFGGDFDARWGSALHEGFVAATAAEPVTLAAAVPLHMIAEEPADPAALDIVFRADPSVWDGRFGNIAWLQELPKPLSKITWENVVAVSPGLAAERGLAPNDVVEVAVGERTIRGPIWIVPGQAKHTIGLTLGYGRSAGGEIAACGGYNAFALLPAQSQGFVRGTVHRVDGKADVATTQAHHRMQGFDFVREVTAKAPSLPEPHKAKTLYSDWPEGDHAWGMVIDLDRCIGCNACIAACNVENNVLVVGKDQVSRGREMLWLRVDRYYTGDIENPRGYFQPVPCMHCENAPCEMGCPVHATVHSPEGINQQVYNRCIGTRTCSSYCPYKVRRFNWYDYRKLDETSRAAQNPDVTVRSRGVMEKCTYCTQRIQSAHAQADKEKRALRTDEVATACQQACPTEAIVFGDLKDPNSAVSKQRASGRHYVLLEELGTRPRTTYLARWNDSPEGEG